MGLMDKPHITKALVAKLNGAESKNSLSIDVTVRNPSSELVQLDDAALKFILSGISKNAGRMSSYTIPSQNYNFQWNDGGDIVVSPGNSQSPELSGKVRVEEDCSRIQLKAPISQTVKPNAVDMFVITIQMPSENKCLSTMDYDNAELTIGYNGSDMTKPFRISLTRYSVHIWQSPADLWDHFGVFLKREQGGG